MNELRFESRSLDSQTHIISAVSFCFPLKLKILISRSEILSHSTGLGLWLGWVGGVCRCWDNKNAHNPSWSEWELVCAVGPGRWWGTVWRGVNIYSWSFYIYDLVQCEIGQRFHSHFLNEKTEAPRGQLTYSAFLPLPNPPHPQIVKELGTHLKCRCFSLAQRPSVADTLAPHPHALSTRCSVWSPCWSVFASTVHKC